MILILIVIMVLIDSASKELSNGGRFVKFDYLDLCFDNLALEPHLAMPSTF